MSTAPRKLRTHLFLTVNNQLVEKFERILGMGDAVVHVKKWGHEKY